MDQTVMQVEIRNPDTVMPLTMPLRVLANTDYETLEHNVRHNTALDLKWLQEVPAHDGIAVMAGGGPSLADSLWDIAQLRMKGATIFAMNAASAYLNDNRIHPHYQCLLDAQEETATLLDPRAEHHMIASQTHPDVVSGALDTGKGLTLWHISLEGIEDWFPPERVDAGGYVILGGGAALGNSALCVAYALGFRNLQIYGYDSSHKDGEGHAYEQDLNRLQPQVVTEWAGRTFTSSLCMRSQADRFQITARALKKEGCKITVHGDGLLPHMYNSLPDTLSEKDKYKLLWQYDTYRSHSPGLDALPAFLRVVKPPKNALIIDYGCGTGRASVELHEQGYAVMLVDFTDNCRDNEAVDLLFLQHDLTQPLSINGGYGFCCDMMEHIPTDDVDAVITNIMKATPTTFFQISTMHDNLGEVIQATLHHTVEPLEWWVSKFEELGYAVTWQEHDQVACRLVVTSED